MRGQHQPEVERLRAAITDSEPVIVGDVVLLEILQGARSDAHAAQVEQAMRTFTIMPMLNADMAVAGSRHYRALRGRGITVRKTIDLIIGTFCIENRYRLLHADRDFEPMEKYLGLRIA